MKFKKLAILVTKAARQQKGDAAYTGSYGDGGSAHTLEALSDFKQALVFKYDLRPSEYYKLDGMEVGEPEEFFDIIQAEKRLLAMCIKL